MTERQLGGRDERWRAAEKGEHRAQVLKACVCTFCHPRPEMMQQIDVYADVWSVCTLSPLNDYYGSGLCAGCHYTSDLSILLAEERKTLPPLSLIPHKLCSHKLKTHTHTPAESCREQMTD